MTRTSTAVLFAALLAFLTFITGITAGYVAGSAKTISAEAMPPTATLAPRQDPKTAYYIGVYDACKLFAVQAAGMSDEESSLECLGFVQRVKDASWYETSGK